MVDKKAMGRKLSFHTLRANQELTPFKFFSILYLFVLNDLIMGI